MRLRIKAAKSLKAVLSNWVNIFGFCFPIIITFFAFLVQFFDKWGFVIYIRILLKILWREVISLNIVRLALV